MTLTLLPAPSMDGLVAHVIPVPVDIDVVEAWDLIRRGVYLIHPLGDPSWAAILVDEDGGFVEVLR